MTAPPLPDVILEPIVRLALLEDLAPAGDITSDSAVPSTTALHAVLRAREAGVVAGLDAALLSLQAATAVVEIGQAAPE